MSPPAGGCEERRIERKITFFFLNICFVRAEMEKKTPTKSKYFCVTDFTKQAKVNFA